MLGFPIPIHSQIQRFNHWQRHECSNRLRQTFKKFCLHKSSNRNKEQPADFSLKNMLACLNTKFQKRERKLWTDTYPHKF